MRRPRASRITSSEQAARLDELEQLGELRHEQEYIEFSEIKDRLAALQLEAKGNKKPNRDVS